MRNQLEQFVIRHCSAMLIFAACLILLCAAGWIKLFRDGETSKTKILVLLLAIVGAAIFALAAFSEARFVMWL